MDPSAKRYLWNVIKYARDTGMTVLLTTHSMEECEALCTKLGILVNGQFECFGNIQHLKAKYGQGYTLILKCKSEIEDGDISVQKNIFIIKNCMKFIGENLPHAVLKDKQQQTLFYQIFLNENQNSIAEIFSLIETNKETLQLETYLLSQTTLEQIFISFAKKQIDRSNSILPSSDTETLRYNAESSHLNIDVQNETVLDLENERQMSNSFNQYNSRSYTNKSYATEETSVNLKDL